MKRLLQVFLTGLLMTLSSVQVSHAAKLSGCPYGKLSLAVGETKTIEVQYGSYWGDNCTWHQWNHTNPDYISVTYSSGSLSGKAHITGIYPGTAKVYVDLYVGSSYWDRMECEVTVTGTAPSITISPSSPSLVVGGTQQLTATVNPTNLPQSVTWSVVEGSNIASVSSSGIVTAKAAGTAKIRARSTFNSLLVYKDCIVTVTEPDPVSIDLNATNVNLVVNETTQLTATVYPSGASQSVTWSVQEGSEVASVDSSGLVTANAFGTAIIRATSTVDSSVYKDCTVTVTVPATSISLNTTSLNLELGETAQLTATVFPSEASQSVTWSVEEGSNVVSVNGSGLVTAKAVGTATIKATSSVTNSSVYCQCTVTVTEPALIPGTWSDNTLTIGENTTKSVNSQPYGNDYSYSTVQMLYTPIEIGRSGTINSIAFKVENAVGGWAPEVKIYLGHKSSKFSATSDYVNSSNLTLVYSGSPTLGKAIGWEKLTFNQGSFTYNGTDNLVVVVTKNKPLHYYPSLKYYYYPGSGYTLWRGSNSNTDYGDVTNTYYWTSTNRPTIRMVFEASSPTSISLNTTNLNLELGETAQLTAAVNPSDAPQSVTWSVKEGSNVVSVSSSGLVTAKAAGTAIIRATSSVKSSVWKECTVTVMPVTPIIQFADAKVKALCVANWDTSGDGELSEGEASKVRSLGTVFRSNTDITSFDELKYFIGLKSIGSLYSSSSPFLGCSGLTSVTIPNTVTSIDDSAFYGCSSLTSVTIPDSVTSIGYSAFHGCSGLTTVTIPNSVTSIESYAFSGCSSLTSITIPNSVTYIGNSAFNDTPWFNELPDGLIYIGKVAYMYKGKMPERTRIDIKDGTTFVAKLAFSDCSGLTFVTIPNSVTRIASGAFNKCSSLISVTIPNGVISIEKSAFDNCSSLTSVTIGSGITSIPYNAFKGCSSLTSITIPESVKSIGMYAFFICSSLTSVTIPESVTFIGGSAFYGCSGLTSVIVGMKTPVAIEEDVFSNRANATLYVPTGSKTAYEAADYWNEFREIVEIDPNIILFADAKVKDLCVANWDTNSDGKLSKEEAAAVTNLGNVFSQNKEITSFDELRYFTGLTSIGSDAFVDCSNLTSITLPKSVTSIDCNPYSGCSSLISIKVIGDNTNYDSRNDCNAIIETSTNTLIAGCLNSVIPKSVATIGEWAFSGCSVLTSVSIPNSVTSIGNNAFWGCI